MSNVIDGFALQLNSPSSERQPRCSYSKNQIKSNYEELVKMMLDFFSCFEYDYHIQKFTDLTKENVSLKIRFNNIVLTFSFNQFQNRLQTLVQLLENQMPFLLQTEDQRILCCKIVSKSFPNHLNKINISIVNGSFQITRPTISLMKEIISKNTSINNNFKNFSHILKSGIRESITLSNKILKIFRPNLFLQNLKQKESFNFQMNRFILRSQIEPAFDETYGSARFQNVQIIQRNQNFETKNLINNIFSNQNEFESYSLYQMPNFSIKQIHKSSLQNYLNFNEVERETLKQKIVPPLYRHTVNKQSKYIYNIIKLNSSLPIKLKKLNFGGFSQIQIGEAEFWYMISISSTEYDKTVLNSNQIPRLMQQKQIIMKKQNRKVLAFKSALNNLQSSKRRITHQSKIVATFKGSSSNFMPQYFNVCNQDSPFSNHLIMEYLPFQTLNEYIQSNRSTMSFITKIHLMYMIVQSLRFLKNYKVVHMDLKPMNIIVTRRLIIKLIDFGESYHPQVCTKNYKPAFSMPYGCPQIFDARTETQFQQKNDTYSCGIIFYQLLFKTLPYIFPRDQAINIFKTRSYMTKMHFVPEQQDKYGHWQITSLLRNVILRCLKGGVYDRPCTLWLTVILKQFLSRLIHNENNISGV